MEPFDMLPISTQICTFQNPKIDCVVVDIDQISQIKLRWTAVMETAHFLKTLKVASLAPFGF